MDPLSITTGCVTLVATITKLTVQINGFVREVRGARSDLDAVSRELHSLTTVLEMLAHDAGDTARSAFPPSLAQQVTGIVKNCGGVVSQIEASLEKHGGGSARLKKGVQWSWGGKSDMEQLRSSLEAHKSALDIALQMVEMSIIRDVKADTQEIRDDTAAIPGIKEDTTQILVEIARLQAKLPKNVELQGLEGHGLSGFMLQRYLDNLTTYAETTYDASDGELEEETAPNTPRAVAEQEEIEHHLEHLNLPQDNTQELSKNIIDRLFEDHDKESGLVSTISKAPRTVIEDASVSVDSPFDSPRSSLGGIRGSESHGSKKRNFSDAVEAERKRQADLAMAKEDETEELRMTNEQHQEKREVKRTLHEEELKRLEEDSKKLDQNEAFLSANNRVEVNHVAIAKASHERSKLSPQEYESLTRELVRNLGDVGQIRDVDISQIRDLLRRGANPNGLEPPPHRTTKNTPIGRAAKSPLCLAVLLEYGVDIGVEMKAYSPEGQITALGIAAQNVDPRAVEMLLLEGANVNGPEHGTSPIHAFLTSPIHYIISTARRAHDRIEILSLLAAHGANVNETGGRWFTALQFACSVPETHSIKVVEQLLCYGAKPNIHGGLHGSAIHAAVTVLNFNTVQLLLRCGADPDLRAICAFTGLSKLLYRSSERREIVTPLELLDKLWLAYSKGGRSRALKIRILLQRAIRHLASSNV